MTELEKIAYAGAFMDKLARGINPLDGTLLPEGDTANDPRLSRCFAYVAGILEQVCENGGVKKRKRTTKEPFSVTLEVLENFEYSDEPIPVSEIVRRLVTVCGENMKRVTSRQINAFLLNCGVLQEEKHGGISVKRPTVSGKELGITVESRIGTRGEYRVVLYSKDAQRFVIDNIEAVAAMKKKSDSEENQ